MGSFEGSTLLPKIATIILAVAFLFHLIAIGAPWWSVSNMRKTERAEHIGLWKYCSSPLGAEMEQCFDFVDIITGGMSSMYFEAELLSGQAKSVTNYSTIKMSSQFAENTHGKKNIKLVVRKWVSTE